MIIVIEAEEGYALNKKLDPLGCSLFQPLSRQFLPIQTLEEKLSFANTNCKPMQAGIAKCLYFPTSQHILGGKASSRGEYVYGTYKRMCYGRKGERERERMEHMMLSSFDTLSL